MFTGKTADREGKQLDTRVPKIRLGRPIWFSRRGLTWDAVLVPTLLVAGECEGTVQYEIVVRPEIPLRKGRDLRRPDDPPSPRREAQTRKPLTKEYAARRL